MKMMIKTGAALLLAPLASAGVARVALPPASSAASAVRAPLAAPAAAAAPAAIAAAAPETAAGFESAVALESASAEEAKDSADAAFDGADARERSIVDAVSKSAAAKLEEERQEGLRRQDEETARFFARLAADDDRMYESRLQAALEERGIRPLGRRMVDDWSRRKSKGRRWILWTETKGYQLTIRVNNYYRSATAELVEVELPAELKAAQAGLVELPAPAPAAPAAAPAGKTDEWMPSMSEVVQRLKDLRGELDRGMLQRGIDALDALLEALTDVDQDKPAPAPAESVKETFTFEAGLGFRRAAVNRVRAYLNAEKLPHTIREERGWLESVFHVTIEAPKRDMRRRVAEAKKRAD